MARLFSVAVIAAGALASAPAEAAVPAEADTSTQSLGGNCLPCPLTYYNLGPGSGSVSSSPPGIDNCRTECAAAWPEPLTVTLRAVPDADSVFLGWVGCSQASGTDCLVELSGAEVIVCGRFSGSGASRECPGAQSVPPPPGSAPSDHAPLGSPCTIVGSARGEILRGTPARDVICGRGGDDVIYAGAGHDLVLGGTGDDRLYGGGGREHLVGAAGHDVLVGGASDDEHFGGRGRDVIRARDGGPDLVDGGPGRDGARVDRVDAVRAIERRF